jgi:hypothetical protein
MSRPPAFPIGCRGKRARFISLRYALKIENVFLLNIEHGKFSLPSPCPITYIFSLHLWIGTLRSVILRNGLNDGSTRRTVFRANQWPGAGKKAVLIACSDRKSRSPKNGSTFDKIQFGQVSSRILMIGLINFNSTKVNCRPSL